ncbi:hypothetical protein BU24DRAFT_358311 [Aaosphaeria arxii CBS 175.79]|uniref:Uncharacterized protein n=1 Tax=Aaosphaeria arxii CBS 175.79 TaxID=1450172 RepID=A0A6A5X981_9PLEO|nr:uncharacterized protein BU24DRAFT_358311 [Aaosphaeria arxii CBS 175.79]KAF2009615.1 hypothetical protein BU24DRAFT_358311 [Aaosphaeria arxii CBS 175.79]
MFRCQPTRTLLQRATYLRSHGCHPSTLSRPLTTTTPFLAQKDAQDKDSLNPRSTEYSKSGGGDDAAAHTDAAFNPNKTRPEEEGQHENPLETSPGNKEVSKARKEDEGGAQGSPRRSTSSKGSAPKAGGGKSG